MKTYRKAPKGNFKSKKLVPWRQNIKYKIGQEKESVAPIHNTEGIKTYRIWILFKKLRYHSRNNSKLMF